MSLRRRRGRPRKATPPTDQNERRKVAVITTEIYAPSNLAADTGWLEAALTRIEGASKDAHDVLTVRCGYDLAVETDQRRA